MPTYFVEGIVVDVEESTKIAAKMGMREYVAAEYVAELHKVDDTFYELDVERNKLSLVKSPYKWLEGLSLDSDEAERVRTAFS